MLITQYVCPAMMRIFWLLLGLPILVFGVSLLLTTSWVVRGLMKGWVLSVSGDKWSVKLDVRDRGGALLSDFAGTLGIMRTKFFPGALHGIAQPLLFLLLCFQRLGLLLYLLFGLGGCLWLILVLSALSFRWASWV